LKHLASPKLALPRKEIQIKSRLDNRPLIKARQGMFPKALLDLSGRDAVRALVRVFRVVAKVSPVIESGWVLF
jgi:hypothetical protein